MQSSIACKTCNVPQRQLYKIWIGYTDCLPRYLVGTHVQCQNLNQFMNMERSSWNFRTVKQLVTQNVSINFCPHKPEIRNSETMINLAGPPRWQLCGAPEEWPANCVLHVLGVLIHCPSDRRQRHTQTRELGGSTCEYNKPSMRSTASLGLGGCQWACFLPFRTVVYFSRLERNKMVYTEKESYFLIGF